MDGVDTVPSPFVVHCAFNDSGDLIVGGTSAQRISKVVVVHRKEAVAELPVGGEANPVAGIAELLGDCLLYTSPSPRDQRGSRMPSSA